MVPPLQWGVLLEWNPNVVIETLEWSANTPAHCSGERLYFSVFCMTENSKCFVFI